MAVSKNDKRKVDWEHNNEIISEAFFSLVLQKKKYPTYKAIAEKTGLSIKTVERHLKDSDMFEDLKIKMRALKDKALLTLAVKAIKGESHHWSRLFFEVMDEVKAKDTDINITINGKPIRAQHQH